jgi:hypothetical protein
MSGGRVASNGRRLISLLLDSTATASSISVSTILILNRGSSGCGLNVFPFSSPLTPPSGHSKAITVNFGYAAYHGGKTYLRVSAHSLTSESLFANLISFASHSTTTPIPPRRKAFTLSPSSRWSAGSASSPGRSPIRPTTFSAYTTLQLSSSSETRPTSVTAQVRRVPLLCSFPSSSRLQPSCLLRSRATAHQPRRKGVSGSNCLRAPVETHRRVARRVRADAEGGVQEGRGDTQNEAGPQQRESSDVGRSRVQDCSRDPSPHWRPVVHLPVSLNASRSASSDASSLLMLSLSLTLLSTYDFTHCLVDSFENISLVLRRGRKTRRSRR